MSAKTIVGGIWKTGLKDIVSNAISGTIIAEAATWITHFITGE